MPSNLLPDFVCAPSRNEPYRILPLLAPSPDWTDFFMFRGCLLGVAWLFWGGYPHVCHCPVFLCPGIWMASYEDPSWACFRCYGHTCLHVSCPSTGRHNAVPCCSIHYPHLHYGMACSCQGRVLQWSLDLDQTLRLHGSHFVCDFWPHSCCQQVPMPCAIPTPDYHAHLLCCSTWNLAVCCWQSYWWAPRKDHKGVMKWVSS